MLSVIGEFCHALWMSFFAGSIALFFVLRAAGLRAGAQKELNISFPDTVFAGVTVLTVSAQFLSLAGGIGGLFRNRWIALILCLAWIVLRRYTGRTYAVSYKKAVVYAVLFFVFAYGASHGIEHYDTGLYHAQAIRWIGEAGVMRGLGNLHTRLAYNSSSFALSAAFDAFFLTSGEDPATHTHAMAAFVALIPAWKCCGLLQGLRGRDSGTAKKALFLSDAARLLAAYYLFMIFDEMVSPAPDFFVTCTLLYLVIAWLDVSEREGKTDAYCLLCVGTVYAVTVKLSVAPMLLLTVFAVWRLVCEKDRTARKIAVYVLCGCIVIAPFLLRNYLLSGYLVYPFPALDLFDVIWKIPKGVAQYDAKEIAVYGRGMTDVLRYADPLRVWFPAWFAGLGSLDRLMFVMDLLVPALLVFFFLRYRRLHRKNSPGTVKPSGGLWLLIVLELQFLYWFLSAPLIRYGKLILWLPAVLAVSWLFTDPGGKRTLRPGRECMFAIGACVLFFAYKSAMLIRDDLPRADTKWLRAQQPYAVFETEKYDTVMTAAGAIDLYAPTDGDRVGALLFASPNRETVSAFGEATGADGSWLLPQNGFTAFVQDEGGV